VAVAQHLAEAEAELFFLVVVGDALDLGDEGGVAFLPGQVEVRFVRQAGPGCQARVAEDPGELVLGTRASNLTIFIRRRQEELHLRELSGSFLLISAVCLATNTTPTQSREPE
jgi:hypothetical protein